MANCHTSKIIVCRGVRSAVLVENRVLICTRNQLMLRQHCLIWCRVVRSRDIKSRDFSAPVITSFFANSVNQIRFKQSWCIYASPRGNYTRDCLISIARLLHSKKRFSQNKCKKKF